MQASPRLSLRHAACLLASLVFLTPALVHASDGPERADVLFSTATTNTLLTKLLPQPIEIAGDRTGAAPDAGPPPPPFTAWLVEARYCGAIDGGRGRVLGVVRSGRNPLTATLLDAPGDCRSPLEK